METNGTKLSMDSSTPLGIDCSITADDAAQPHVVFSMPFSAPLDVRRAPSNRSVHHQASPC